MCIYEHSPYFYPFFLKDFQKNVGIVQKKSYIGQGQQIITIIFRVRIDLLFCLLTFPNNYEGNISDQSIRRNGYHSIQQSMKSIW